MYAPFGGGVLVGPRSTFETGDPFLAGGGAVDLVDLDEVVWTDPPEREEAGSPNVVGAVALHAAIDELARIGWPAIIAHDDAMAARAARRAGRHRRRAPARARRSRHADPARWRRSWSTASTTRWSRPGCSAEHAIGVRHGCFCAHPYLLRLLGLDARRGRAVPRRPCSGATGATSPARCGPAPGISTTAADVDRFLAAVADIAGGGEPPVPYDQDPVTGDYWPRTDDAAWASAARRPGTSCARCG